MKYNVQKYKYILTWYELNAGSWLDVVAGRQINTMRRPLVRFKQDLIIF